jgi:hypothetical protein
MAGTAVPSSAAPLTFEVLAPRADPATLAIGLVQGPSITAGDITEIQRVFTNRGYTVTTDLAANWTVSALGAQDCLVCLGVSEGDTGFRDSLESAGKPIVIGYNTTAGTYSTTVLSSLLGLVANEQSKTLAAGATLDLAPGFRAHEITSRFSSDATLLVADFVSGTMSYQALASTTTLYAGTALVNDPEGVPVLIAADRGAARGAWRGGVFSERTVWHGALHPDQGGVQGVIGDGYLLIVLAIEWAVGKYDGNAFL